MEEFTIQSKNIVIQDVEILNRIKVNKIEFLHFYAHKEKSGVLSIIATTPPNNEATVSKSYHKVTVREEYALVQNPRYLKRYIGKKIYYYTERLFPEENEVFRIQPINFRIETTRIRERKTDIKQFPYFSKGGEFIIPQHYLNKKLNHKFVRMKISFNRTTKAVLGQSFLFAFLIKANQTSFGRGKNLYGFRTFSNGLRTKKLNFLVKILKNHNKNLEDYHYVSTMPYEKCPYGLIIFEEKK